MAKKSQRKLRAVDLFCGAGGVSTALLQAGKELGIEVELTAVNHWDTAINSHSLNHPSVFHICEPVENLWPPRVVPSRHLDILCASCECTFHSIARGGGPCNEQSRAQPWQIIRWATDLDVKNIFMENVKEFLHWGPLLKTGITWRGKYYKKNCPDPRRKGEYFQSFVATLRGLGYTVEHKLQACDHFGDATSRVRLILIAVKNKTVPWPERTHAPAELVTRHSSLKTQKVARDIIDWDLKGQSIFNRKRPLAPNTLKRIEAGLRNFGGPAAEPFILMMRGTSEGHLNNSKSVDEPLDTITTSGKHHYLCQPYLVNMKGTSTAADIDKPMPTATCKDHLAVAQPIILGQQSCSAPRTVQTPLPTVAGAGAISLIEPIIVQTDQQGGNGHYCSPMDKPIKTVVTKQNMALVQPFLVKANHGTDKKRRGKLDRRCYPVNEPLKTVTARNGYAVCEPVLNQQRATSNVQPFLVKYYGTGTAVGVNQPLDTVTCKDRFLLVEPQTNKVLAELDILFRMLQPHELAAAHSFPKHYVFTGTKEDQTAQIGNSVPVKTAQAHHRAILLQHFKLKL